MPDAASRICRERHRAAWNSIAAMRKKHVIGRKNRFRHGLNGPCGHDSRSLRDAQSRGPQHTLRARISPPCRQPACECSVAAGSLVLRLRSVPAGHRRASADVQSLQSGHRTSCTPTLIRQTKKTQHKCAAFLNHSSVSFSLPETSHSLNSGRRPFSCSFRRPTMLECI